MFKLGDKVMFWNYGYMKYIKGVITDVTKQWYRIKPYDSEYEYARHESEIHRDKEQSNEEN